jgi:hypothetical protein
METIYESIVLHYLTHEGLSFVCPQFPIKGPNGCPWSAPDFVALNFKKKQIEGVEVSVASNVKKLFTKVANREAQWTGHLQSHLARLGQGFEVWPIVVKVFVRKDFVREFEALTNKQLPVEAEAIEDVVLRWKWPWGAPKREDAKPR